MLKKYWLSICLLITFIRQSTSEIAINGNIRRAKHGEYSFAVSISHNNRQKKLNHLCGGSLITYKHVVTAAHCFHGLKKNFNQVVVLTNDGDLLHSVSHKVKNWTTYSEWSKANNTIIKELKDIAVVELRARVNSQIKLVELSCTSTAEVYGDTVKILGWAAAIDNPASRYLSIGDTLVLPTQECLRNLEGDMKSQINITGALLFMCSRAWMDPPLHTGAGDSGSAVLIQSDKLIAVHIGSCRYTLDNGLVMPRQSIHLPVKYFITFLNDMTGSNERIRCAE